MSVTYVPPAIPGLSRHLSAMDEGDRYQAALDAEEDRLNKEMFAPGEEDAGAVDEAIQDMAERSDNLHELALHIRRGELEQAQKMVEEAIEDWIHQRAVENLQRRAEEAEQDRAEARAEARELI